MEFLFPELALPLSSDLWDSPICQVVRARQLQSMGDRFTAFLRHVAERLYGIDNNPMETRKGAAWPGYAGVSEELGRRLDHIWKDTNERW